MENKLKINEPILVFILSILVYGFYGVATAKFSNFSIDLGSFFFFSLPVILHVAYIWFLRDYNMRPLTFSYSKFKKNNLFISIFLLFLAFLFTYLIDISLTGDSLYFSNYGFIHSISILPQVKAIMPSISNLEASLVLRLLSLVILLGFCFLTYLFIRLQKINYYLLGLFSLIVLVLLRTALSYVGGNPVIHSPLSGSYLMLFGTFFGINDLTLQSAHLFAYLLFAYFIFSRINVIINNSLQSLLITSAIFSLPASFLLGTAVEPALWTVICYSIVLVSLSDDEFDQYRLLVYVVIFFSFFRVAAIFSLFPIIIHFLLNKDLTGSLKDKLNLLFSTFFPAFIFSPFFLFAFLEGSAATTNSDYSLFRLFEIVTSGKMWFLYADVISPIFLVTALVLLALNIRSSFTLINLSFFCILSYVFFSIDENLWTFTKYRLEAFMPLFISQAVFTLRNLKSIAYKKFIAVLGALFLCLNLSNLYFFSDSCLLKSASLRYDTLRYETQRGCNLLSNVPFNFSEPLNYINKREALGATFIPGVYYGAFIHIVNETTLSDFLIAKKIWDDHEDFIAKHNNGESFSADVEYIQSDKRIEYVLLGFTRNLPSIKSSLISEGWNEVYSSVKGNSLDVFILQRPQENDKTKASKT
tara:strand:+ start:3803 stop:5728 length:1926 start_codon:yes stop_codon:yes gene_type:complete